MISKRSGWLGSGLILLFLAISAIGVWWLAAEQRHSAWSDAELALLDSLRLSNLPPLPADPTNRVADDPGAAALGHRLFFDSRLSANGAVSCASCHQPDRHFTDGLATGVGLATGQRNTMGLVGTAYSPWYFWDGRKDSQWSQALGPLENDLEHGGNRMQFARLIADDPKYRAAYEALFDPLPDLSNPSRFPLAASPLGGNALVASWNAMTEADQQAVNAVFANIGKALAAYQRLLLPGPAPFDDYVEGLLNNADANVALSGAAVDGLKLFIGKAQCVNCHNGPLLTNNAFHNTGVLPAPVQLPGMGRARGVRQALADPFNCLGKFSDSRTDCAELRFARSGDEILGARRTPSLRNVAETAPYMHAGQLATLDAVLNHYNLATPSLVGHNEAKPLSLRPTELRTLAVFLQSLSGPVATDPRWLTAPATGG